MGFQKLLSQGKVTKKFKINADMASASAVEKVKAAGGEVILKQGVKTAEAKGTEKVPKKVVKETSSEKEDSKEKPEQKPEVEPKAEVSEEPSAE